jgi:hypothetical protein
MHSVVEILKSGENQPLYNGEDHRGRKAEHEGSVRCFYRAQHTPRGGQKQIAVAQCRIVDGRVVIGGSEFLKLSTQDEQDGPQIDLSQMCDERYRHHERDCCDIIQGIRAQPPALFLVAKKIHRGSESEHMDENRAFDCRHADGQRKQDRELMILYHLLPTRRIAVFRYHADAARAGERLATTLDAPA